MSEANKPRENAVIARVAVYVVWFAFAVCASLLVWVVPMADDWYLALHVRDQGFYAAWREQYLTWSGNWFGSALHFAVSGVCGVWWATWLSTTLAFAGLFAALRYLCAGLGSTRAGLIAALLISVYVATGYPRQTVYWATTARSYIGVLAYGIWLWSLTYRWSSEEPRWWRRILLMALGCLVMGWCETGAPMMMSAILMGMIMCGWQRVGLWVWLAVGVCIGAVPHLFSPGNMLRMASVGGPYPVFPAAASAWASAYDLCLSTGPFILVGFMWAHVSSPTVHASGPTLLRCLGVGAAALLGACIIGFPSALATNEINPRVRDMGWWLILLWMAWAAQPLAASWRRCSVRWSVGVFALMLGVGAFCLGAERFWQWAPIALMSLWTWRLGRWRSPVAGAVLAFWAVVIMRDSAHDAVIRAPARMLTWAERHQQLTVAGRAGEKVAWVRRLPPEGYPTLMLHSDIAPNPGQEWNLHVAHWYGVEHMWLEPAPDMSPTMRARYEASFAADVQRFKQKPLPSPP